MWLFDDEKYDFSVTWIEILTVNMSANINFYTSCRADFLKCFETNISIACIFEVNI